MKSNCEILRTDTVQGWPLAIVREGTDEIPLIEDLELGRRLGFERPRDVRKLIKTHEPKLGRMVRDAVARTPGPDGGAPTRPFLLTEEQALFIAAKSETEKATELLRGMIAVFLAWKNGKLSNVDNDPKLLSILDRQTAVLDRLSARLDKIEEARENGNLIGETRAQKLVLAVIRAIVKVDPQRSPKDRRSKHREISNAIRDRLKLGVSGAWAKLPERHLGDIQEILDELLKAEKKRRKDQLEMGWN
jgi:hypothetical protein